MASLVQDHVPPAVKAAQLFEPTKPAAVPASLPPAMPAAPVVATPAKAPAPAATAAVFDHLTDGPAAGLAPKAVKTQAIHADSGGMLDDIVKASGLSAGEKATARSSASHLLEESAGAGVTNLNQFAYELATARRESHMGNWMNEFGGNAYFENRYFNNKKKAADLGNTQPGDGAAYHGRGLVQVTGRHNYTDWTNRLAKENFQHNGQAVDLVHHPELAAQPDIAARIAVEGMRDGTFTKFKLSDYVNDNNMAHPDYVGARRVINGQDAAVEIANQATSFQHVLEQHRGDYTDAMLKTQMKNLPTASSGELSGNPAALADGMLSGTPLTSGAAKFVPADQMLRNQIGHFSGAIPAGKITTLTTHPADQ